MPHLSPLHVVHLQGVQPDPPSRLELRDPTLLPVKSPAPGPGGQPPCAQHAEAKTAMARGTGGAQAPQRGANARRGVFGHVFLGGDFRHLNR